MATTDDRSIDATTRTGARDRDVAREGDRDRLARVISHIRVTIYLYIYITRVCVYIPIYTIDSIDSIYVRA